MTNIFSTELQYLIMMSCIMVASGLAKDYNLLMPLYAYLKDVGSSNRLVVLLASALGGILPVEGRVTISAGMLDTLAPKDNSKVRSKFGILDYLATHHYYLWSPLEKTVIIPIAAFGLSYFEWIKLIFPLLIVSFIFILVYFWVFFEETDITITKESYKISQVVRTVAPMFFAITYYVAGGNPIVSFGSLALYFMLITKQWNLKKLSSYLNIKVLCIVAIVLLASFYVKLYSSDIEKYITMILADGNLNFSYNKIVIASLLSFTASFLLGSSGKFVAFSVLMAQIFGIETFIWFFALDFSAYLISPTHKCVAIGQSYFNSSYSDYLIAITSWSYLLIVTAFFLTF